MKIKGKLGFCILFTLILQLVLMPIQSFAEYRSASITQVVREAVVTTTKGDNTKIKYTLFGTEENYNSSNGEFKFKSAYYEEIIPKGVKVKVLPIGFYFEEYSRKLYGNLDASMKRGQSGKYELVCTPFEVVYEFPNEGEYYFSNAKLHYTDPFDRRSTAEVTNTIVNVRDYEKYPQISMEVYDGERIVDSSPIESNDLPPTRQKFIISPSEKLKAKEGAIGTINITGHDLLSTQYAFINDPDATDIDWLDLESTINIKNPPDLLDEEGLKSRYYDVSHMPLLTDTEKWSNRGEVFKNPKDEIIIRSGLLETARDNSTGYDQIKDNLFFGHVGAQGVDYKEAAKFWGYIVPDRTGDFYFAIQSDDGNYAYIIVGGEKIVITDYFRDTSPRLIYTNEKVSLKKDIAYPIYIEYFNWGGEGEFQMFMKDTPWNGYDSFMGEMYGNPIIRDDKANNFRVPNSWFKATSNNDPGENAEATFEASKVVKFPEQSGKYYLAARSENKRNNVREVVYGPFIVDNDPPEIILEGDTILNIVADGEPFKDPGYSARDFDYDLGEYVEVEVNVEILFNNKVVEKIDTNELGTYTIIYTAEDEFGNKAKETRTVIVTEGIILPKVMYIQKGSQKTLEAILNPDTLRVNWSDEAGKNIISLTNATDNSVKVTGNEVGVEVITASIIGTSKTATTIVYVVDLKNSDFDDYMLKSETMGANTLFEYELPTALTPLFGAEEGINIKYITSGNISYNGGDGSIKATDKGRGILTAIMTAYDEEKDENIEIATVSQTIPILTVDAATNVGYISSDYAIVTVSFKLSDGEDAETITGSKEMVLGIAPSIGGIADNFKITKAIKDEGNLEILGNPAGNKRVKVKINGEGDYKLTLFLDLTLKGGLKIGEFKEWVGNNTNVNVNNKFYLTIDADEGSAFVEHISSVKPGNIP